MGEPITSIEFIPSWGTSPARINRLTGGLQINDKALRKIKDEDTWMYILGHEYTHSKKNTMCEFEADSGASEFYFKQNRSPINSVKALANVLSFNSPEHKQRVIEQLIRAAKHDWLVNGNEKAGDMLKEIETSYREPFGGNTESNFCLGDNHISNFETKLKRKREAKKAAAIAAAVQNAIANNSDVQTAITTAAQQAVQNTPPPSVQQNTAPQPGGGGGGISPGDDGSLGDGADDSDSNFCCYNGRPSARERIAYRREHNYSDFFLDKIFEGRQKMKEEKFEAKRDTAIAQANATTAQAQSDNAEKAKEADAATKQTEAVSKTLKEDKGSNNMPLIIGVVLLFAVAAFVFLNKKKKGAGAKPVTFSAS